MLYTLFVCYDGSSVPGLAGEAAVAVSRVSEQPLTSSPAVLANSCGLFLNQQMSA